MTSSPEHLRPDQDAEHQLDDHRGNDHPATGDQRRECARDRSGRDDRQKFVGVDADSGYIGEQDHSADYNARRGPVPHPNRMKRRGSTLTRCSSQRSI